MRRMKRLFFVMNPFSGMRKASKVLPSILSVFNRAGFDVLVHITQTQGDAKKVVAQRAKDMDLVVCCGGDGTFNETVAGLMESGAQIPMGYIPAGSTNDFAASLGLPPDPVEAAWRIVGGTPRPFDLGLLAERYFSYVASFGAFTRASYATPQNIKNALGHTAYLLGSIQEISQLKALPVRLELDGEVLEDKYLFGAISNTTRIGGVLNLDPKQVDLSDGLFEVILVRMPKDLAEIAECIQAVQKSYYNCRMITFRSVKALKILADPTMDWTVDGEREPGQEAVEIKNLHHAYRLMV